MGVTVCMIIYICAPLDCEDLRTRDQAVVEQMLDPKSLGFHSH